MILSILYRYKKLIQLTLVLIYCVGFTGCGYAQASGEILVIGNNAVDRLFFVDHPYGENGKRIASDMQVYYGGQASNVAYTMAPLVKEKVTYIGPFGNDMDAEKSRTTLEEIGVNVEGVVIDCLSNSANVIVDEHTGDRYITFYPSIAINLQASDRYSKFVEKQAERDFSDVHFVYSDCRLFDLSNKIFEKASEKSIPIVLDIEVINKETLKLVEYANVLITNDCIIRDMAGEADLKKALKILANRYDLNGVVATSGPHGYTALEKSDERDTYTLIEENDVKIQVKDTTGAGDAFHAAFIVGLSRKMSFSEALHFANIVAAEKCKCNGPKLIRS